MNTAVELCKRFEGFRAKPYRCPAGVPTIGYGTTRYPTGEPVQLTDTPIDEATAEAFLTYDLERFELAVLRLCPQLSMEPEARLGAVVSWTYNLGIGNFKISTMRRRLIERKWDEAADECRRWIHAGGKKLPGLVLRREYEAKLIARGE